MTAQPDPRGDVAVLVVAAGAGTRLGPGQPKALRPLRGEALLVHAARRVAAAPSVGCVVVAAPSGEAEVVRALVAPVLGDVTLIVVEGGADRQDSVANALRATPAHYPIVLVHDAARALAPAELVERVAAAVRTGHEVVIPVLPVVDTVKRVDDSGTVLGTVDRTALRAVQTPQGFRRATLVAAHEAAADRHTDDAGLAELIGVRVYCVPGSDEAMKITRPIDLAVAELLLDGGLSGA